jgi:ABC-2 type transport system ATP-binding protein
MRVTGEDEITMPVLQVENLTKDYGFGRGVFDVSFHVNQGEVFGFLGPNGAGKTTTIRHIMGFSRPQHGTTFVEGLNSWERSDDIQKLLGYLPGEIALPESLTGTQFIQFMADLRGLTDMTKTQYLLAKFDLNPAGSLKRMSLGMKRKLAIITAFMHDPKILVLDEPTSGLDPIMQKTFIEFILEEKALGKTILLSSHIFSEVDATCDRIAIIKDGKIVSTVIADHLRHYESKTYKVEFATPSEYERFLGEKVEITFKKPRQNQVKVLVEDADINAFIHLIATYRVNFISQIKFTLEDYFMDFYDKNKQVKNLGA